MCEKSNGSDTVEQREERQEKTKMERDETDVRGCL